MYWPNVQTPSASLAAGQLLGSTIARRSLKKAFIFWQKLYSDGYSSNTARQNKRALITYIKPLCLHHWRHSMAVKFLDVLFSLSCLCLDIAGNLKKETDFTQQWVHNESSGMPPCCPFPKLTQRTEIKGRNRNITPSCTSVSLWKILGFNVKPTVRNMCCIRSSRLDHSPGWRGQVI